MMAWKNEEDGKKYYKIYYQEHKENLKEYQIKWKSENRGYVKWWNDQRRIKLLTAVSNNKPHCVRCGCDDVRLLEINHKDGGGNRELQQGKAKTEFYQGILKGTRKTDDLEILCRVCNSLHYLESKFGKLPFKVLYNKIIKEEK